MPKTRTALHRWARASVWLALFPTGCSYHASWESGSSTTSNEEARAREPRAREPRAREPQRHRVHRDARGRNPEADAEAKRGADERIAAIDRETQERVAQAEREAAEEERRAEEEAAKAREQARAEEEQRARDAQAAASGAQGGREMKKKPSGIFIHNQAGVDEAVKRRDGEIDSHVLVRKTEIRKKLDRTKADILVAAERKRNEVNAQLKEDAAKHP